MPISLPARFPVTAVEQSIATATFGTIVPLTLCLLLLGAIEVACLHAVAPSAFFYLAML